MTLFYVVETEDDAYLGEVVADSKAMTLTIYNGFRGHPKVVHVDDIELVTEASLHADVEVL